ncbi:MAG: type II secretion system F family protein [Mycobacterium leprae]
MDLRLSGAQVGLLQLDWPILLTLSLLALSVAGVAWWIGCRLPQRPRLAGPQRVPRLSPLERFLEHELGPVSKLFPTGSLLPGTILAALLGLIITWPFHNELVSLIGMGAVGSIPYQLLCARVKRQHMAIQKAVEPALVQIAQIYEVRRHPYLALCDAVPVLAPPLQRELQAALQESQAGLSLADALRQMAARCYNNFYLHQLAELVAVNIQNGGDLAESLRRLAARLRLMDEVRAEETAELFGYRWLTRLLYGATLLPLLLWAWTTAPNLTFFVLSPWGRLLLVWVVLSGLIVISLPYWLAIDD